MSKILFVFLSVLVTGSMCVNIDSTRMLRRREFKKAALTPEQLKNDNEFKGFHGIMSDGANVVTEMFSIESPANKGDFIIGDAGGSGTRLYIGLTGLTKVFMAKSDNKITEKTAEVKKWIEDIKAKMNKPFIFVGATAGMRVAAKSLSEQEAAICGGEAKKTCFIMVLPGAIEGILGWIDGTSPLSKYDSPPNDKDCYLEIGSTSSQLAIPQGGGKMWVMSGVMLAYFVADTMRDSNKRDVNRGPNAVDVCDGKHGSFSYAACKDAVKNKAVFWDAGYKKCIGKKPQVIGCTRILVREMPVEVMGTVQKDDDTCKSNSEGRAANFRCSLSAALNKWLVEDIGVGIKSAKLLSIPVDKVNYGVEWAWGLISTLNKLGFDAKNVKFDEHAKKESDCGFITPSVSLTIS